MVRENETIVVVLVVLLAAKLLGNGTLRLWELVDVPLWTKRCLALESGNLHRL